MNLSAGYVEHIVKICQHLGFNPNLGAESVYSSSVVKMVEMGFGVSIEPMSAIKNIIGDIKLIELKNVPHKVEILLLWKADREEDLKDLHELLL